MAFDPTSGEICARRAWEQVFLLIHHDCCPPYGSWAWLRLPDEHPCRFAALVRAAACWARDGEGTEIAMRFLTDIINDEAVWDRIEDEEWRRVARQVVRGGR